MDIASQVWENGKVKHKDKVSIFPFCQGLSYGACAYEGIRFYVSHKGQAVFRLNDHARRFFYSASVLRMNLGLTEEGFCRAVIETISANGVESGYVRPFAFFSQIRSGPNTFGSSTTLLILVMPDDPDQRSKKTTRLIVSSYQKPSPKSMDYNAKIGAYYATALLGCIEASEAGYDEPLFLDQHGFLTEAATSNIFMVKDHTLYTPRPNNILPGITRDSLLALAKELNIKTKEKDITKEEISSADEVFLTGTGIELKRVQEIADLYKARSRNSPMTEKLESQYVKAIHGNLPSYDHWLTVIS